MRGAKLCEGTAENKSDTIKDPEAALGRLVEHLAEEAIQRARVTLEFDEQIEVSSEFYSKNKGADRE